MNDQENSSAPGPVPAVVLLTPKRKMPSGFTTNLSNSQVLKDFLERRIFRLTIFHQVCQWHLFVHELVHRTTLKMSITHVTWVEWLSGTFNWRRPYKMAINNRTTQAPNIQAQVHWYRTWALPNTKWASGAAGKGSYGKWSDNWWTNLLQVTTYNSLWLVRKE